MYNLPTHFGEEPEKVTRVLWHHAEQAALHVTLCRSPRCPEPVPHAGLNPAKIGGKVPRFLHIRIGPELAAARLLDRSLAYTDDDHRRLLICAQAASIGKIRRCFFGLQIFLDPPAPSGAVEYLFLHKFLSIQSRASMRPHCSANAAVGKDLLIEITRCAATAVQSTSTTIVKPSLVESSVAVISTS